MKKILLSLVAGLLTMAGFDAQAQVVGFITHPAPARGNLEIGTMASGWAVSLDSLTRSGRLVVGRSAGGAAAGDSLGCDTTLLNAANMAGKIVVLYRGACEFGTKALAAQRAGAIGCIIVNNQTAMINLAGGGNGLSVTIPTILITQADGARLRPFIDNDSTVALIGQKRGFFANDFGFSINNLIRPIDFAVPATQAERPGDYVLKLGADVVNYGQNAQTNVNLNVKIDFTNPAGATSTIYNQNGTLAALPKDSTRNVNTPDLDLNAFGKGRYTITYTATSTNTDDFNGDNVNVQTLILSDSVFSKARVDSLGRPTLSGGVRPGDASAGPYDIGVFFYAKRGHRVKVEKLKFAFVTNAPVNLIGETVVGKVQQWIDADLNDAIDPGELLEIGEGFYTYNDSLGSNSVREVVIEDINTSTPGVKLDSNGVYIISVAYTGTSTAVFTCIDPGVSFRRSEVPYDQWTTPVFSTTWNPVGFTEHRVPSISAITSDIAVGGSVENKQRNDMNIRVYPNPARNDVYVRLSAESMIGKVSYDVMDITGRVVMSGEKMIDGFSDQINLSVGSLQQGVYTVVTKTAKGFNSSRFVVSK